MCQEGMMTLPRYTTVALDEGNARRQLCRSEQSFAAVPLLTASSVWKNMTAAP